MVNNRFHFKYNFNDQNCQELFNIFSPLLRVWHQTVKYPTRSAESQSYLASGRASKWQTDSIALFRPVICQVA